MKRSKEDVQYFKPPLDCLIPLSDISFISKTILTYVIKIIWFLPSDAFLFTQLWIEVAITQSKVSIYFN